MERSGVMADLKPVWDGTRIGLWALIVLPAVFSLVPIWI